MYPSRLIRPFVIAVALSSVILVSAAARWHLDLRDSFPKADQVLAESPDTIRLWFNQVLELSLAAVSLEGEDGRVNMGKPQKTNDPKSFAKFRKKVAGY